jgi:NAD(P) transhydrogenase subunit alpha
MAALSSRLYSAGIVHLIDEMGGKEAYSVDLENEIIRGALVLREGSIMWPPPKPKNPGPKYSVDTGLRPSKEEKVELKSDEKEISFSVGRILKYVILLAIAIGIYSAGNCLPNNDPFVERFIDQLTVFVLACFVGWQVIWNVKPALHTPLMSVTNAISGIIIIGGILQISQSEINASVILGAAAILLAAINVVGGFLVTNRMLAMFRQ